MAVFENIPDHARVWIYQSNHRLEDPHAEWLQSEANDFVANWAAHGKGLKAEAAVLHNYFLIFMIDEAQAQASGCSIDASVNFVRSAQLTLKCDFFQRLHITYRKDKNSPVESADQETFEKMLESGAVNEDTIVFNNLVNNKAEWLEKWEVPLSQSWHAKFFSKV
ncbi:MAG: hypothetical protein WD048_08460 [Chitinophagales bacterium]